MLSKRTTELSHFDYEPTKKPRKQRTKKAANQDAQDQEDTDDRTEDSDRNEAPDITGLVQGDSSREEPSLPIDGG